MEALALLAVAGAVYLGFRAYKQRRDQQVAIGDAKRRLAILPAQFIVLDIETTGLKAETHEIIEIAAIRVNRDSDEHDTFRALIKPNRRVPARITELTGITQEILDRDGEPLEPALRQFHEFIGDHRIVAFNAEFDMAFLRRAAGDIGLDFRNDVSCALKRARRAWPGRRSYRLRDLSKDGGLDVTDSHRALGDCTRTLIVYSAAAAQLQRIA